MDHTTVIYTTTATITFHNTSHVDVRRFLTASALVAYNRTVTNDGTVLMDVYVKQTSTRKGN